MTVSEDPFDIGQVLTQAQQMDQLEQRFDMTTAGGYDAKRLAVLSEDELLILTDLLARLANHLAGDEPIDPAIEKRLGHVANSMCSRIYSCVEHGPPDRGERPALDGHQLLDGLGHAGPVGVVGGQRDPFWIFDPGAAVFLPPPGGGQVGADVHHGDAGPAGAGVALLVVDSDDAAGEPDPGQAGVGVLGKADLGDVVGVCASQRPGDGFPPLIDVAALELDRVQVSGRRKSAGLAIVAGSGHVRLRFGWSVPLTRPARGPLADVGAFTGFCYTA